MRGLVVQDSKDLRVVLKTLKDAVSFHQHRDLMNTQLHLADVRWSPLTVALQKASEKLEALLEKNHDEK